MTLQCGLSASIVNGGFTHEPWYTTILSHGQKEEGNLDLTTKSFRATSAIFLNNITSLKQSSRPVNTLWIEGRRTKKMILVSQTFLLVWLSLLLLPTPLAWCQTSYDFDKLADAIFLAEGGWNTKHLFGILSVPCSGYQDCRQVCLNTVRNTYRRWQTAGNPGQFLVYLGSRYAPPAAHPLNRYWVRNVRRLLNAE